MSCFIHADGLAKPRLPAGAPRNMWLANQTLENMNAGGRAIPVALTQQHIVMFEPRFPDLIWPTCLVPVLHKICLELGTVLILVSSRFQILVGEMFVLLRILLTLSKEA